MAEIANLLIKGECPQCGHTIQFIQEEDKPGTYSNVCGVCENALTLAVVIAPAGGPTAAKATTTTAKAATT